jgi:hypothetical protein
MQQEGRGVAAAGALSQPQPLQATAQQRPPQLDLRLLAAACNLPHEDKVATGGEDAFFVSRWVGVAHPPG